AEIAIGAVEAHAGTRIGRIDRLRTRGPRVPMRRARRRMGSPVWWTGRARTPVVVPIIVPARTTAAEIVGGDPTVGAALLHVAPAAATILDVDLLAAAQRVDH